jgi:type VI secretion system FHA domain protein
MSGAWAAPQVSPPPAEPSAWDTPVEAAVQASGWSSPVSDPGPPGAMDVWGAMTSSVGVDWARGGFGAPEPDRFGLSGRAQTPAAEQSLGLAAPDPAAVAWGTPQPPAEPAISAVPGWGAPEPGPAIAPPALSPQPLSPQAFAPPPHAGAVAGAGGEWAAFLGAAGVPPHEMKAGSAETLAVAGSLLKRMIAGLVVMLEARARAKSQLGAQGTSLEFAGNNPLKFARSPDKALAQMLNPPERGFMPPETAIEDAFRDLQAHQVATLAAMQGALAATLARFSPQAIRGRAEMRGVLAKILPSAREATLWQAYEREFEGVAKGSDEAFMEVFAKEFRTAYERVAAEMKQNASGSNRS